LSNISAVFEMGLVYQKIRLRKYYIKYFSFQGGDFPPIAVCKTRL